MDNTCPICGTIYTHKDFAEECSKVPVHDVLNAEVGEQIIITRYYGNDYAQPPKKPGLVLLWDWSYVREKAIKPFSFHGQHHEAWYKIGDIDVKLQELFPKLADLADRWEDAARGEVPGIAIGPYHYWSKKMAEKDGLGVFPDCFIERCRGQISPEMVAKLKEEGYDA